MQERRMRGGVLACRAVGLASVGVAVSLVLACGGSTIGGEPQDGGAGSGGNAMGGMAGVGGTVTGGSGGLGGLGGTGGTGGTAEQEPTAHPPPDPGGPPAGGSQVDALVVQKLFLGELDRQGLIDPDVWKSYGYDLDGYYSNEHSTLHCAPVTGANPVSVKTDGDGGIDNSFGANLLPILKVFVPNLTNVASGAIHDGGETYLFRFVGLGPGPDQSPVSVGFLISAKQPWAPAWDGKDSWWISSWSVNGSPDSPKVLLPSYVASATWVAHASGPLTVTIPFQNLRLSLVIHDALITAELSGSGSGLVGKNGAIAGVLDPEALVAQLEKMASGVEPNLCDKSSFDAIAGGIRAASDIMKDGSNGDPSQECNGISIGLGFESVAANIGLAVPTARRRPPRPARTDAAREPAPATPAVTAPSQQDLDAGVCWSGAEPRARASTSSAPTSCRIWGTWTAWCRSRPRAWGRRRSWPPLARCSRPRRGRLASRRRISSCTPRRASRPARGPGEVVSWSSSGSKSRAHARAPRRPRERGKDRRHGRGYWRRASQYSTGPAPAGQASWLIR